MSDSTNPTRKGLSRRDMIKASAVAGAAAWTAPVIIDSLASPAAALSQGSFCIAVTAATCAGQTAADYTTAFTGSDCTTDPCTGTKLASGTLLSELCITASTCTWTGNVSFSIGAGCSTCTFVGGTGAIPKPGSDCDSGTLSGANKTITFNRPASATGNWVGFRLAVTCT